MAFSDLGSLGAIGSTANNQASLALTTTAACAAGELVVVVVAVDNPQNGGDSGVASVTNSGAANTWTKATQICNAVAAQGGASCSIWYSHLANSLAAGATIAATFSTASTSDASGLTARHFSTTGSVLIEGTPGQLVGNTAADPGSLDVTTANIHTLRVRGIASQVGNNTNLTPTASWTAWANGNSATSGTTAEVCARAEHRILTGTSAPSDPTYVSAIYASVYVAFKEGALADVTGTLAGTDGSDDFTSDGGTVTGGEPPTQVAFRSLSSTDYTGGAVNTVVPAPAGVQDGDLLVQIFLEGNNNVTTDPTPPSGWTLAHTYPSITNAGFYVYARLYTKIASSEPANYAWTHTAFSSQAVILAFTGADENSVSPTPTSAGNAADWTATAPSITAPASSTIIYLSVDWGASTLALDLPTGAPFTFIERYDAASTASSITYVATGDYATGGATGAVAHDTNGIPNLGSLISIAPAAPTGVTGTLSTTDAADVCSASGLVGCIGTLAATEASSTAAFSGGIIATGTLAVTDAADVCSTSGLVGRTGTLAATEASSTAAFSGGIVASGTLAVSESADVSAISGAGAAPEITGTFAATEAASVAAITGSVASAEETWSVFTTQTPSTNVNNDGPYEMGMLFKSSIPGYIVAIRFYKEATEGPGHTGRIWLNSTQALLTSVTFSGEASSGWVTQDLPTPLEIIADTLYMVSVNTAGNHYVATNSGLDAPGVSNGPLTTNGAPNGFYGSPGAFPTGTWQNSNYFRDVVFSATAPAIIGAMDVVDSGAVELLLHMEGADASTMILDSGGSAHAVTAHGAAQIDTGQSVFAGQALQVASDADYLTLDTGDYAFGTGDFCIDFRARLSSASESSMFYNGGNSGPRVYYDGSVLKLESAAGIITGSALAANTNHHIAATRAGTSTRLWLNGVQQGSTLTDATSYVVTAGYPRIGGGFGPVEVFTDTFERANTSPSATPGSVGNGWIDKVGGTYFIDGGKLKSTGFAWEETLYREFVDNDWSTSDLYGHIDIDGDAADNTYTRALAAYNPVASATFRSYAATFSAQGDWRYLNAEELYDAGTFYGSPSSWTQHSEYVYRLAFSITDNGATFTATMFDVADLANPVVVAVKSATGNGPSSRDYNVLGLAGPLVPVSSIVLFDAVPSWASDHVAYNNAALHYSSNNWYNTGSSFRTTNVGAYVKFKFTGTRIVIGINATHSSDNFIGWQIDGGVVKVRHLPHVLSGVSSMSLAQGLANTTHEIIVYHGKVNAYDQDRWTEDNACSLEITGFDIDSGKTVSAPTLRAETALFYGDSMTETAVPEYSWQSYSAQLANLMNVEYGQVGFSYQGWTFGFVNNNVGDFEASWPYIYSTHSRLSSGTFILQPDYIFINQGQNDVSLGGNNPTAVQAAIVSVLPAIRTAAPSATIFLVVPFTGAMRSAIGAAFNTYQTNTPDSNAFLIDIGLNGPPDYASDDGLHPTAAGAAYIAGLMKTAVDDALA